MLQLPIAGGVPLQVRVEALKLSHDGSGDPSASAEVYVIASPLASVAPGCVKLRAVPAEPVSLVAPAVNAGAALFTVSVNVLLAEPSSVAVTLMVYVPAATAPMYRLVPLKLNPLGS